MGRSRLLLCALAVISIGCNRSGIRRESLPVKPKVAAPVMPSPIAKANPISAPGVPMPIARDLPDTTDYKAVPPRLPEQQVVIPVEARATLPDAAEEDRKTLRERLAERRDEKKEKEQPKLPSPFAPKAAPPAVVPMPNAPAATGEVSELRKLFTVAAKRYDDLVDFEAQLVRSEVVNGKQMPSEEVIFQFRKTPFSIYMKNTGETGRGREVLFVQGKFDDKMHVVTGEGDNRLMGAGFKTSLRPDSPLAAGKSRHKITDGGPGSLLLRFETALKLQESGKRPGAIKRVGLVKRKEFATPLDAVEIAIAPGDDAQLPKGGKQTIYFDAKPNSPSANFPVMVITHEPDGRVVEYYCFTNIRSPANLTDADFHPDRLVPKKK